jgi:hypothetical protein
MEKDRKKLYTSIQNAIQNVTDYGSILVTHCEEDNEWFCNKPVGRDALAAYDKAIKEKIFWIT